MAKIVMGYWDCANCGRSVKGTLRVCPGCSHPRGSEVKFYMKDIEYLTEEEAAKTGMKPDWLCEYCGTYNNDQKMNCEGCGAPRSNNDYFDNNTETERATEKEEDRWECAYCGAMNPPAADHCAVCKAEKCVKEPDPEPVVEKPKKKMGLLAKLFLLICLGLAAWGIISAIPKTKTLDVKNVSWVSSYDVEKSVAETVKTTNKSEIPDGATYKEELESYTEKEKVGSHIEKKYVDLGNGTFEEQDVEVDDYEDVTKTRTVYYYSAAKWKKVNSYSKSGTGTDVEYADYQLANDERAANIKVVYTISGTDAKGKEQSYKLTVSDNDKAEKQEANKSMLKEFEPGKNITFRVRGRNIIDIR